jgi:hypothetical protein
MQKRFALILAFLSIFALTATSGGAAEGGPDEASERLERLEKAVENLQRSLDTIEKQLRSQDGRQPAAPSADPVVGSWQCTNNLQTMNLTFQSNGRILIEEPTLKAVRSNTWTRLNDSRISIVGGIPYEITFDGPDSFILLETNSRSTGTCRRQ